MTDREQQPQTPIPTPPDPARVRALRHQLERDLRQRRREGRQVRVGLTHRTGKQIKDIGAYTMIPTMMVAGPALGYGFGWVIQEVLGGAPWVAMGGMFFGLIAAFRQIYLLLAGRTAPPSREIPRAGPAADDDPENRP